MTKSIISISVIILGLIVFAVKFTPQIGNTPIQQEIQNKEWLKLKAPKDKIITNREVDDIREVNGQKVNYGKVIAYDYLSDKKAEGDFLFYKGKYTNAKVVSKRGNEITANFYPGDNFSQEADGVHIIEYATTTIKAYEEQTKLTFLERLFPKAIASDIYVSAYNEGVYYYTAAGNTWTNVREATTNVFVDAFGTGYKGSIGVAAHISTSGNWITLERDIFPIDTSAIGAGSTINSAAFNLYFNSKTNNLTPAPSLRMAYGDMTSTSATNSADYNLNLNNNTSIMASDLAYASITTGAYNTFTLTDFSEIQKTGTTIILIKTAYDADDSAPTWGSEQSCNFYIAGQQFTGTDKDPYITITWSGGDTGFEFYDVD